MGNSQEAYLSPRVTEITDKKITSLSYKTVVTVRWLLFMLLEQNAVQKPLKGGRAYLGPRL